MTYNILLIFLLAIVYDFYLKELPVKIHPVVWMGNIVNAYKKKFPPEHNNNDYAAAAGMIIILLLVFIVPVVLIGEDNVIIQGIILSSTFSFGYFVQELKQLFKALNGDDLSDSRKKLSYLVSRDTSQLTKEEVTGAAIETAVENITDSITAPLFYFLIGGVPLAVFYRIFNTLDAMIGYKDTYFYYGKIAAKIDDVLNYIPARLTVLFLCIVTKFLGDDLTCAIHIYHRDKHKTDSPNAGHTMAFMAGVLKVNLNKRGVYSLGDNLEKLSCGKFKRTLTYLQVCVALMYGSAILTILFLI